MSLAICLKSLAAAAFVMLPEEGTNLSKATQEAYLLFRGGQVEEAVKRFEKQAALGDETAMFALGTIYHKGVALEASPARAEKYYSLAAEKGYAPAQYNLGLLLREDAERKEEAGRWLRDSARGGSKKGMLWLGVAYLEGSSGFDQDAGSARLWLEKAAEAGSVEAEYYLGRMHEAGFGVEKDLTKAGQMIGRAAEAGVTDAMMHLAKSYLSGALGETSTDKALELLRKGAGELDLAVFQSALGLLYEGGQGVEKDYEKALFWYDKAASGGDPGAYNKLGFFYERGLGVEKDESKAMRYYKSGASAGVAVSMYNVAQMYDAGKGVDSANPVAAAKWMQRAALAGMPLAQNELAVRYRTGKGVLPDVVAAAAWFERAARSGLAAAQVNLAQLHEGGDAAIPKNMQSAAEWYFAAASQGHPQAMYRLGELYEAGIGTEADPVRALALYSGAASSGYAPAEKRRDLYAKTLSEAQRAEAEALWAKRFKPPVPEEAP